MKDEVCIAYSFNLEALYKIQDQLLAHGIHTFIQPFAIDVLDVKKRSFLMCHIDDLDELREYLWSREEISDKLEGEEEITWEELLSMAHDLNRQQEISETKVIVIIIAAIALGITLLVWLS